MALASLAKTPGRQDATASGAPRMSRRWLYLAVFALQLAIAPFFVHDWDGFVLIRSALEFAGGVSPYATSEAAPPHIYLDDQWPPVNTWYAYPPLVLLIVTPFVAAAQWLVAEPWALRVALKLPFIVGNLALAHVAWRLVLRLTGDARKATLAERMLLLNPFLIFLAAAWGMFDAIMMALLLLSLLWLSQERHGRAGVVFGLAALVKVFPLFVAPLWMIYAWRRDGGAKAARFVGAAAATGIAVALPFFLLNPRGFLEQTLLMHWARGAQGFALVSFPLQLRNLNNLFGWSIPIAPQSIVLAVAGMLLIVTVLLLLTRAGATRTPLDLLRVSGVIFTAVLLVNKVVNEQYLVMPIVVLTLLAVMGTVPMRWPRVYVWGAFVSSVLIGLHFVTFIPADLTGGTTLRPDELVQALAHALDLPVIVVFSVPHALAILALVPALVVSARFVWPDLRAAVLDVRGWLAARLRPVAPRRAPHVAAFALMLLVALPPVTSGVLAVPEATAWAPELPERGIVLAQYDLAISNPSHDPEVRDGFWARGDYAKPVAGFYSATTGKVREDLATLAAIGVDVVIVSYSAGNRLRLETFIASAAEAGLRVAPMLDLGALAHCPDAQRLRPSVVPPLGELAWTPENGALAKSCAEGALRPFRDHAAGFRVDGRPVLWLTNATMLDPRGAWTQTLAAAAGDAYLVGGVTLARPRGPLALDAAYVQPPETPALDAWRDAARGDAIVAAFPGTWALPAPAAWEASWQEAAGAAWIVLPWNLHRDAAALEPVTGGPDLVADAGVRIAPT